MSEVWSLGKEEQGMLGVQERKMLRKVYGRKKVNEGWERTNQELYELFNKVHIVGVIKAQRISWVGQVMRINLRRVPNTVIYSAITTMKM